jgi:molecular chaperone DnaK (HSP70)
MFEEVDYSEESKYDLFESVERNKEKFMWAASVISQTAPSYEIVAEKMKKLKINLTKKEFEKICKQLYLKP